MEIFERCLSLWIALEIGAGVLLGSVARGAVELSLVAFANRSRGWFPPSVEPTEART